MTSSASATSSGGPTLPTDAPSECISPGKGAFHAERPRQRPLAWRRSSRRFSEQRAIEACAGCSRGSYPRTQRRARAGSEPASNRTQKVEASAGFEPRWRFCRPQFTVHEDRTIIAVRPRPGWAPYFEELFRGVAFLERETSVGLTQDHEWCGIRLVLTA